MECPLISRHIAFFATACAATFPFANTSFGQATDAEARVFALVDRHVAEVRKRPATPEYLKANVERFAAPRLPPEDARFFDVAKARFLAGVAPHFAEIGREAERRLDVGMKGNTVRTAETENAYKLCETTWTNDRSFNAAFGSKCMAYAEALRDAACKASLVRTNSRKIGHSRVVMAEGEDGKLKRIDFDQLVCSAAIDGFEISVTQPWLFGSSTMAIKSTIMPGHTISISISRRTEGGRPVWVATDMEDARPPFDRPLETLACLQYDKRGAAPALAVNAALAWWSDSLVDNPYALGFLQGGICVAWKNAWNLGLAEPEGLGFASVIKQIIGN